MRPLPRTQRVEGDLPVGDGTRRRILEVGLLLFAREGFHGASVRDLAQALELQPSALYAHFPSKEHLLAELVRLGHELHHHDLCRAVEEAGPEPEAQLRAAVRAHTLMHATHPQLAVVVNEEMHALPPELAAPGLELRRRSAALLLRIIEGGVRQGRFHAPQPEVVAAAIGAIGLRVPFWFQASRKLGAEALADLHADLALRMVQLQPRRES